MTRTIGVILLSIWLIAYGLMTITNIQLIAGAAVIILGCLAIAAGVCLLLGK